MAWIGRILLRRDVADKRHFRKRVYNERATANCLSSRCDIC